MKAYARFDSYREIIAKFGGMATSCGHGKHAITKGDVIGYAPRSKETQCAACWSKWKAENAAADFDEMSYVSGYGGY